MGTVDEPGGGTLDEDALAGRLQVHISDGDGSYEVLLPVSGCKRRGLGSVECGERGDSRTVVVIIPDPGVSPTGFRFSIAASRLPVAQTGVVGRANPLDGPIKVDIVRDWGSTTQDLIDCRQASRRMLLCR